MEHDLRTLPPFDLYELSIFQIVAEERSFTRAAGVAGLTQSAITRRIQDVESRLGVKLFNRTTRRVELTEAGRFLHDEATRLLGDVSRTIKQMRSEFGESRPEVRIGVSRAISQAFLPGFLHANLRSMPEVACRMTQMASVDILKAIESNDLDTGILTAPSRLPKTASVVHQFDDAFTLLVPTKDPPNGKSLHTRKGQSKWGKSQTWILPSKETQTGRRLRSWLKESGWDIEPTMVMDNFDLIINLVALGVGVAFVPIRSLASFARKDSVVRIPLKRRFERKVIVVTRNKKNQPSHVTRFVDNILF